MKIIIEKLEEHLKTIPSKFIALGESAINEKLIVNKWSKKEILGHLVDSAINNLQRIIRVQNEPGIKIVYYQDEWVEIQDYQNMDIESVMQLWISLNKQFIRVIKNFPLEKLKQKIDTGMTQKEMNTAEFLITDYLSHMEHHLNQIFKSDS